MTDTSIRRLPTPENRVFAPWPAISRRPGRDGRRFGARRRGARAARLSRCAPDGSVDGRGHRQPRRFRRRQRRGDRARRRGVHHQQRWLLLVRARRVGACRSTSRPAPTCRRCTRAVGSTASTSRPARCRCCTASATVIASRARTTSCSIRRAASGSPISARTKSARSTRAACTTRSRTARWSNARSGRCGRRTGSACPPTNRRCTSPRSMTGRLWAFDLPSPGVIAPGGTRSRRALSREHARATSTRSPSRPTATSSSPPSATDLCVVAPDGSDMHYVRDARRRDHQRLFRRPRSPHRVRHVVGERSDTRSRVAARRPRPQLLNARDTDDTHRIRHRRPDDPRRSSTRTGRGSCSKTSRTRGAEHVRASRRTRGLRDRHQADRDHSTSASCSTTSPSCACGSAAGAVSGATMVGINPTRQGAELARDITYTDCQLIVTESRFVEMLDGLDLGLPDDRILVVDTPQYADTLRRVRRRERCPPSPSTPTCTRVAALHLGHLGRAQGGHDLAGQVGPHRPHDLDDAEPHRSRRRLHGHAHVPLQRALRRLVSPVVYAGGTLALRRQFSASGFLPDVRKFKADVLQLRRQAADLHPRHARVARRQGPHAAQRVRQRRRRARHPPLQRALRRAGAATTTARPRAAPSVQRVPEQPKGALGPRPRGHGGARPRDAAKRSRRAEFDDERAPAQSRRVHRRDRQQEQSRTSFEGYYNNDEANEQRIRNGWYWTGDLGYRDDDGWFYFAGRDFEWLRVDGENFSAAPIERIVGQLSGRHPRRASTRCPTKRSATR